MPVAAVRRVYMIARRAIADGFLDRLQTAGVVHLEPLSEDEAAGLTEPVVPGDHDVESRLGRVEAAADELKKYEEPAGFFASLAGGRFELDPEAFREMSEDEKTDALLERVESIQRTTTEAEVRRARLESSLKHLMPWMGFDVPVEDLQSTRSVEIFCGSVPAAACNELATALNAPGERCLLDPVALDAARAHVVVVDLRGDEPDAARLLREAGYQPTLFPPGEGTPAQLAEKLREELAEIDRQEQEAAAEAARLAPERIRLLAACDRLAQETQRIEGFSTGASTRDCVVFSGWVREGDLAAVRAVVDAEGDDAALIDRAPLDDENPPVALDNRPMIRPFQVVTNLYGLPRSREIDPTPLLAPFFILSFGIAVGEGGYGILLAALSKLGLRFLKLDEGGRRLLQLLFYCGIATFVAGVLMGSVFAIDYAALPGFLQPVGRLLSSLKALDPLQDSLLFLGIVLGIGFLQVWLGVLINAIIRWRDGNRRFALFHEGGWLVLLPMLVLMAVGWKPAGWISLAAAASIFVSAGFEAKSVGVKIGLGLYALYGVTSFFGDILSYSRLFALGLATGVIAQVVNILAGMVGGVPWIGWLLMLVVLVFGHLFNLAINALGAFIHTARLQFVEFFTKFFEGGGRSFVPFARRYRFTTVVDASTAEAGRDSSGE